MRCPIPRKQRQNRTFSNSSFPPSRLAIQVMQVNFFGGHIFSSKNIFLGKVGNLPTECCRSVATFQQELRNIYKLDDASTVKECSNLCYIRFIGFEFFLWLIHLCHISCVSDFSFSCFFCLISHRCGWCDFLVFRESTKIYRLGKLVFCPPLFTLLNYCGMEWNLSLDFSYLALSL